MVVDGMVVVGSAPVAVLVARLDPHRRRGAVPGPRDFAAGSLPQGHDQRLVVDGSVEFGEPHLHPVFEEDRGQAQELGAGERPLGLPRDDRVESPVRVGVGFQRLRWWDLTDGRPLDDLSDVRTTPILALAPVVMPPKKSAGASAWITERCDGRTVLATGHRDGGVRLWDPATDGGEYCEAVRGDGRPVVSLAALDLSNDPPWEGTDLFMMHGDVGVAMWSCASQLRWPRLRAHKLAAIGQEDICCAAVWAARGGSGTASRFSCWPVVTPGCPCG